MKAKRRHELQTNALADWLGKQIGIGSKVGTKIAAPIRPYSKMILGVVIGLAAVGFAAMYLSGAFGTLYSRVAGSSGGPEWAEYFAAYDDGMQKGDAEALNEVAKRYDESLAGIWAAQSAGDIELMRGSQMLYREREEAERSLKRAKESYEEVLRSGAHLPLLNQRARYGLAQVHECLSVAATGTKLDLQNHLDQAAALYGELAEDTQNQAIAEMAKQHLNELTALRKDGFYAWLAANEPVKPSEPGEEAAGASSDLEKTAEKPEFTVPAAEKPKAEKPAPMAQEPVKPKAEGQAQEKAAPQTSGKDSGPPEMSLEPPESPEDAPAPPGDSPK